MPYEKFADGTRKDLSEEIPFELPHGWAWTKLENVAKTISAKSYQILESEIQKQGRFPVVSQGRCHIDGYCDTEEKVLSDLPLILFGDHTRAVKYIDFPFVIGADGTKLFNPYTNARWLYFWTCYAATSQLKSRGYGRHWNLLNLLLIPLPPLAEQQRIVAKIEELFAYADKIAEADNKIAITAKLLDKKILDLAIRGQLVAQDPTDEPASELLKRIQETKKVGRSPRDRRAAESFIFRGSDRLAYETVGGKTRCIQDEIPFDIPDSWEWARLGTISDYGKCRSVDADDVSPDTWSLDLEDIEKGTGRLLARKLAQEKPSTSSKHVFTKGLLLYSKLRTYLNKVLVADMDGVCTSEIIPVVFEGGILPTFMRIVLMSPYFLAYTASKDYGVKMPRLGTSDARAALIPLPPLAEQKRIVAKVEELKAQIKTLTM